MRDEATGESAGRKLRVGKVLVGLRKGVGHGRAMGWDGESRGCEEMGPGGIRGAVRSERRRQLHNAARGSVGESGARPGRADRVLNRRVLMLVRVSDIFPDHAKAVPLIPGSAAQVLQTA